MKVLSAQALVSLLLAIGIERALALPTPDVTGDVSIAAQDDNLYQDVDLVSLDDEEITANLFIRSEPGDDQSNPIKKKLAISGKDVDGLQELADADCYAHLCQETPVIMNYWSESAYNRAVKTGNGAVSRQIFKDEKQTKKWETTTPDAKKYVSPEEWPPASVAQSGASAILMPVTKDAQDRQKTLLTAFYKSKPTIKRQDGLKGSSKGSWFQITEFDGAEGPYCKKLNELLHGDFDKNFSKDGKIKNKPEICTEKIKDLQGLKYDMGSYAYKITDDKKAYTFVGKKA